MLFASQKSLAWGSCVSVVSLTSSTTLYRHPCLAELRAASTRHSPVGRTTTPCNISLAVLVACLFAGAVFFAQAMLRRGFFVGIFWVVFRCVFSTWDSKSAKIWNPKWKSLEEAPRKSERKMVRTLHEQTENVRTHLVLQRV